MAFLLVNWDSDDSVSVISQKAKGIISQEGLKVSFKWPGKGVYDGTILATSDCKKDMEAEARLLTKATEENQVNDDTSVNRKRKLERSTADKEKSSKKTKPTAARPSAKTSKTKHSAKMASLNASNIAAKELFSQQSSSLEVKRLQAELEATKRKLAEANEQISLIQEDQDKFEESSSDDSVIDVSPYEAAAIKNRERNLAIIQSLGLLKQGKDAAINETRAPSLTLSVRDQPQTESVKASSSSGDKIPSSAEDKREKIPIQKIELVKNMGVLIKSTSLAAVLRKSKRQPTRLLRALMEELFTEDELRCSSVRGKKGAHPALDVEVMDAILCYTMAKGDEWGHPITEESLVRQGNEKCYQIRKKKKNVPTY